MARELNQDPRLGRDFWVDGRASRPSAARTGSRMVRDAEHYGSNIAEHLRGSSTSGAPWHGGPWRNDE